MDVFVSFADVQAALQRCLAKHPPQDFCLCRDASLLADVFGEMAYTRQAVRALAAFTDDQRGAFSRWEGVGAGVLATAGN